MVTTGGFVDYSTSLYRQSGRLGGSRSGASAWAIQDMLPVGAAISKLQTGSVQLTFFIFLLLFTVLLFAEIGIMLKAIKKGPEGIKN